MGYEQTCYTLIAYLLLTTWLTAASQMISGMPLRWKRVAASFGIHGLWCLITFFISNTDSPFKMLLAIGMDLMNYALVYRLRGSQLFIKTFGVLLCTFGGDIISGMVMLQLFDSDIIYEMRAMTKPSTILLQFVIGAGIFLLALLYRGGSLLLDRLRKRMRIGYLVRPILLLCIIGVLFAQALLSVSSEDQTERLRQLLPHFVVIALLMGIGVTYVAQDIRFFRKSQENKQLLHQQSLQSLLLQDTRIFRHNISNMLHGMQGTLLSGDVSAIAAYYDQMVEQCQRINNENVVALRRLPSMAVASLLLTKVQKANADNIPFFITVSPSISWRGLRDSDMTQVLGVLLDNALEAATESRAPYVAFEACNTDGALSIIIRNTYRTGDIPVFGPDIISTKEDHAGMGLRSVQQIIGRYPRALFNIYAYNRYVEASVTCY